MQNSIRLLRVREVSALVCLSKSTIYALIKRGAFPAPIKLAARTSAWSEEEILAWIDARARARLPGVQYTAHSQGCV